MFRTLINVDQGVVIAWFKFGPAFTGLEQDPPVTTIPRLKNWADIAFLDWQRIAKERDQPVNRLRYIFSSNVENSHTKDAIRRILGERLGKDTCGDYLWTTGRREFFPKDEGYKALLASPNGRGAALMLITHKAVFGERRMIGSIHLWCEREDGKISLLFAVNEHDEEDDDDDWDDDGEPDDPGAPLFSVSLRSAAAAAATPLARGMETRPLHQTRVHYL